MANADREREGDDAEHVLEQVSHALRAETPMDWVLKQNRLCIGFKHWYTTRTFNKTGILTETEHASVDTYIY